MKRLIAMSLALASLAACDGSSTTAPHSAPPAQPQGVNFTAFTLQLLGSPSDSAPPVSVGSTQFVFPDDDNPQAFAAVLPST